MVPNQDTTITYFYTLCLPVWITWYYLYSIFFFTSFVPTFVISNKFILLNPKLNILSFLLFLIHFPVIFIYFFPLFFPFLNPSFIILKIIFAIYCKCQKYSNNENTECIFHYKCNEDRYLKIHEQIPYFDKYCGYKIKHS